jgi:hypothetical protein
MSARPTSGPMPWKEIAEWALVATAVISLWVFLSSGGARSNPLSYIQPGEQGPSIAIIHHDFPEVEIPAGLGLDGQQYYAIARNPTHLHELAPLLDRPRYRLQRPLLPWLAWAAHPTGGGYSLAWTFVVLEVLIILGGSIATGVLAVQFGGRPWVAAVFALSPGAWWSLRTSGSDALALALAIAAMALAYRYRWVAAVLCGIGAALAKEVILIVLLGWAIWQRKRAAWLVVAVPAAVAMAWWLFLKVSLPGNERIGELAPPFVGWWDAITLRWVHDKELVGAFAGIGSAVIGIGALVWRKLRHPLGWAVLLSIVFAIVGNRDVIGNNYGSTRTLMPIWVLGLVMLFTPGARQRVETSPEHGAAGSVGPGLVSTGSSNR